MLRYGPHAAIPSMSLLTPIKAENWRSQRQTNNAPEVAKWPIATIPAVTVPTKTKTTPTTPMLPPNPIKWVMVGLPSPVPDQLEVINLEATVFPVLRISYGYILP